MGAEKRIYDRLIHLAEDIELLRIAKEEHEERYAYYRNFKSGDGRLLDPELTYQHKYEAEAKEKLIKRIGFETYFLHTLLNDLGNPEPKLRLGKQTR